MSGNNHRTTRHRNRNNCFLNMKRCLKTVISFSTVSFPVGRVGTFPLNFTPTSLISRCLLLHERYYRRYTYIRVGTVGNIPLFPLSPSLSHIDTHARTHKCQLGEYSYCHRRLANELYKYHTSRAGK